MLNTPFTGLSRVEWRGIPHNIIERASGCLRALYGGNTESIRSYHGDNHIFRIGFGEFPALGAGGWGVGAVCNISIKMHIIDDDVSTINP